MSRAILYSILFLVLISFETSFLSSWPIPWSIIPVLPIVGIWLYHQHESKIGLWYLIGWGLWHDYFDLPLWSSKTVIAILIIATIMYTSRRIFSHQSIYGLMGTGLLTMVSWTITETLFRFFSPSDLGIAFDKFISEQILILIFLLLGTALLFFIDLQTKNRFRSRI